MIDTTNLRSISCLRVYEKESLAVMDEYSNEQISMYIQHAFADYISLDDSKVYNGIALLKVLRESQNLQVETCLQLLCSYSCNASFRRDASENLVRLFGQIEVLSGMVDNIAKTTNSYRLFQSLYILNMIVQDNLDQEDEQRIYSLVFSWDENCYRRANYRNVDAEFIARANNFHRRLTSELVHKILDFTIDVETAAYVSRYITPKYFKSIPLVRTHKSQFIQVISQWGPQVDRFYPYLDDL